MMSDALFVMPQKIQTRWASPENWDGAKGAAGQVNNGRKGSACFPLKTGEHKVLAHAENTSGTIRRIWITINDRSPQMLRGLRLDMYWDGADRPAVSAPLGDFFGQGLGRCATFQSALFSNPEGRSFNCCVPMPFRTGMKIVVTNESGADLAMFFYDVNYTLGDEHGPDTLYRQYEETLVFHSRDPRRFDWTSPLCTLFAHAAEFFDWRGQTYITHCGIEDRHWSDIGAPYGLYMAALDWAERK